MTHSLDIFCRICCLHYCNEIFSKLSTGMLVHCFFALWRNPMLKKPLSLLINTNDFFVLIYLTICQFVCPCVSQSIYLSYIYLPITCFYLVFMFGVLLNCQLPHWEIRTLKIFISLSSLFVTKFIECKILAFIKIVYFTKPHRETT